MEQLRAVLFRNIATIRISERFTKPEMATDMFEHDQEKLEMLWRQGRDFGIFALSHFSEGKPDSTFPEKALTDGILSLAQGQTVSSSM